jgi:hypothetical protein
LFPIAQHYGCRNYICLTLYVFGAMTLFKEWVQQYASLLCSNKRFTAC